MELGWGGAKVLMGGCGGRYKIVNGDREGDSIKLMVGVLGGWFSGFIHSNNYVSVLSTRGLPRLQSQNYTSILKIDFLS